MKRPIFITATDTGAGKSVVAACILSALAKRAIPVFPFKPVQSGCLKAANDLNSNDALLLKVASLSAAPLQEINPYSFKHPVSPHFAARQEGVDIDVKHLLDLVRSKLENNYIIIEGAGGIASPFTDSISNADFAKAVNAVVITVTTPVLGTINRTMLTLDYIDSKNLEHAGVIINRWPRQPSSGEQESVAYICRNSYSPVLGYVDEQEGLDLNNERQLDKLLDDFNTEVTHSGLIDNLLYFMGGAGS